MAATIPDEILDRMCEKFPMLSDSTRLAILRSLMQGERNVTGVNSRASQARDQIQAALGLLTNNHSSSHQIPVAGGDDPARRQRLICSHNGSPVLTLFYHRQPPSFGFTGHYSLATRAAVRPTSRVRSRAGPPRWLLAPIPR